jgi:hypothetical protein
MSQQFLPSLGVVWTGVGIQEQIEHDEHVNELFVYHTLKKVGGEYFCCSKNHSQSNGKFKETVISPSKVSKVP